MNKLTDEEKATNYETMLHIQKVAGNLNILIKALLDRGQEHDSSKLDVPEVEYFTKYTCKLSGLTYGSKEFDDCKKEMQPALDHHYANNRHHPEHWENGVADMDLIDLTEMICDWYASCKRHDDGNIRKSLKINAKRFNMDPQLVKILENTVSRFEK